MMIDNALRGSFPTIQRTQGRAMAAAVRTGECGVYKRTLDMEVGRLVSSVEGPLRNVLQERFVIRDDTVVCDDCLRKVQPIPRRMGPPWARTKWAERTPERAPLCARGGWDCPGQKLESQSNHTQELLPFNRWSRHLLDKYQIAPYAVSGKRRPQDMLRMSSVARMKTRKRTDGSGVSRIVFAFLPYCFGREFFSSRLDWRSKGAEDFDPASNDNRNKKNKQLMIVSPARARAGSCIPRARDCLVRNSPVRAGGVP